MVSFWGPQRESKKKVKKKDMSWTQAKVRYPMLSPFKDADKDGVKNWLDCKPFDKKRHMTKYYDPILKKTFQSKANLIKYGRPMIKKRIKKMEEKVKKIRKSKFGRFNGNVYSDAQEQLEDYELDKKSINKKIKELLKKEGQEIKDEDYYDSKDEDYGANDYANDYANDDDDDDEYEEPIRRKRIYRRRGVAGQIADNIGEGIFF